MTAYRSDPAKCIEEHPRYRLPSGKVVTTQPLFDGELWARLDRDGAIVALERLGLVLPSTETVLEIARVGFWTAPVTLPADALMRTRARCEEHDAKARAQLAAWDGVKVCSAIGKWHVSGAAPGANRIAGWPKSPGGPLIQQGIEDVHIGEALTDYATLTMGEEPGEQTKTIITRTLTHGTRGKDVGWLQRQLGLADDQIFGPRTEAKLAVWQAAHKLAADGIAGEKTITTMGGAWRPASVKGDPRAPACIALLRDLNRLYPNRNRASDGIMGDAAHQLTASGHNSGNAVDVTHDPPAVDCAKLRARIMADPRTLYTIFQATIENKDVANGKRRAYTGKNRHDHHMHVEVRPELRANGDPWL